MIKFFLCLGHGELIHLRNEKQDLLPWAAKSKGFWPGWAVWGICAGKCPAMSTGVWGWCEQSKKFPLALFSSCCMAMEYPTWSKDSFPGSIFPEGFWNGFKLNSRHIETTGSTSNFPLLSMRKHLEFSKWMLLYGAGKLHNWLRKESHNKTRIWVSTPKNGSCKIFSWPCIFTAWVVATQETQWNNPRKWLHLGRGRHLYLGIKCRMIDLQAPEIATKPGTEEQARTKCEWEGKFRLDSGRQCKPEPRRNFSWGGGS